MRYMVIAKHWDNEQKKCVNYVVGESDSFVNANLLKTAYNEHYKANATVVDKNDWINK